MYDEFNIKSINSILANLYCVHSFCFHGGEKLCIFCRLRNKTGFYLKIVHAHTLYSIQINWSKVSAINIDYCSNFIWFFLFVTLQYITVYWMCIFNRINEIDWVHIDNGVHMFHFIAIFESIALWQCTFSSIRQQPRLKQQNKSNGSREKKYAMNQLQTKCQINYDNKKCLVCAHRQAIFVILQLIVCNSVFARK